MVLFDYLLIQNDFRDFSRFLTIYSRSVRDVFHVVSSSTRFCSSKIQHNFPKVKSDETMRFSHEVLLQILGKFKD